MSKLYRLLFFPVAAMLFAIVAPIAAVAQVAAFFAPAMFGPLDARLSLALDAVAGMIITDPVARARHMAFIDRANAHAGFIGGRFAAG